MEILPNITNFCVVKVLGNQTSLVSTKSGHLCVLKQYKFNNDVVLIDDLMKCLSDLKNLISSHFLLQIDYYFVHMDTLYIVFEYCEGGSLHELQLRITLYNDNLYKSELIEWFCQMVAAIHELIAKDILKFCDNTLDSHWFFFKNNCLQLDTSKLLVKYLSFHLTKFDIAIETITTDHDISVDLGKISLAEYSLDHRLLIHIALILYELAAHKKLDFTGWDNFNHSLIEKYAQCIPTILRDLWIKILTIEITFPDIMNHKLIKETMSEFRQSPASEEPLIFNVESLKGAKTAAFDYESVGS